MSNNVIRKTTDQHGIYRYVENVNLTHYPSADWLHDPDVSGLTEVERKYWKVSGASVIEMDQSEKDAVDLSLRQSAMTHNESGEFVFGNRGKTINRWLRTTGLFLSSQHMPTVVMNSGSITGLNFINYKDNADTDLEIYINGSLTFTWQIRGKRYAYKTNGLASLAFVPGDKISVRLKDAGTVDPIHPLVTVQYKYEIQLTGEGGASTL